MLKPQSLSISTLTFLNRSNTFLIYSVKLVILIYERLRRLRLRLALKVMVVVLVVRLRGRLVVPLRWRLMLVLRRLVVLVGLRTSLMDR